MTNSFALGLAAAITGFFVLDYYVLHLDAGIFLMRYLIDAIAFLAVWR
ncbi:MAG: hypothetical protein AAFP98_05675 [Pseudomonadota bacterium]